MPPGNGLSDLRIGQCPFIQHPVHQGLVAQSQCFVPVSLRRAKIHKALAQTVLQLCEQLFPALAGQIHLVYKNKRWHVIAAKQPPKRFGVALHAVRSADHQHRIIQYLQRALSLGGKIHMAGCIQQRDLRIAGCQQCLLRKNSDSACFFKCVGIQKGILVIHPAQLPDGTGAVEHGFGQGRFAGVHMSQNAQNDLLMRCFHPLLLGYILPIRISFLL